MDYFWCIPRHFGRHLKANFQPITECFFFNTMHREKKKNQCGSAGKRGDFSSLLFLWPKQMFLTISKVKWKYRRNRDQQYPKMRFINTTDNDLTFANPAVHKFSFKIKNKK